eukprot:CAMPEP_0116013174 /NCGR_PEP_ID=MMETSP0321-20121206/5572_1 /TAXON_ID=163516 /ORGANISM="Leptocylindrus danicus var. danicus, Strain B650" /LENGTH=210 /DNA_ID=CAMNT_0003482679 /DNA_START=18 /DNA_END=650 /DNA_ORIENTATION=+
MGRGSNYVNNNRGVALQAPKKKGKKGEIRMIACQYGTGCIRPGCIYSHPSTKSGTAVQSMEPCMAFLAGTCAFSAKGCKKRHPSKEEAQRLISKYQQTRCRFGDQCRTNGCLYLHPRDNEGDPYSMPLLLQQDHSLPLAQAAMDTNNNYSGGAAANWGYNEYYTASYSAPAEALANTNSLFQSDPHLEEMRIEGKNVNAREFVPGSWKAP